MRAEIQRMSVRTQCRGLQAVCGFAGGGGGPAATAAATWAVETAKIGRPDSLREDSSGRRV